MPPLLLLSLLIAITGAVAALHLIIRHRQKRDLRQLANEWQMRYAEADLFNLGLRIAGHFPVAGTSDLRVLDLIYASEESRHRYLFTAEFTTGAGDQYRRQRRAMTFCDPVEAASAQGPSPLLFAPAELPLVQQYQHLRQRWTQGPEKSGQECPPYFSGDKTA
jgi:hypothetical protein